MANTNDYKPFATGSGALVLSSASYAALAARISGFGNGVADPQQVNTVWRQASVVAAAIAQLAADYGPGNVVDDGNVTNLENQILAAIRNAVATTPAPGIPYEGTDTGAAANAVYVQTTNPASSTLAAGQVFLVTKNALAVTGATTFKNGANPPVSVKSVDGSDLLPNDWSANYPALLYIINAPGAPSGSLIAIFQSLPRLNFPGLSQKDALASGDVFAFYSVADGSHRKTTFANLLSLFSPSTTGRLLNVQTFSTPGTFTYTPTAGTNKIRVTVVGAGGPGTGAYGPPPSGQYVCPGGGGAGGWARADITSNFSGTIITVGAGGTAGSGSVTGSAGGSSSFGSFASSTGGNPANTTGFVSNSSVQAGGSGGVGSLGSGVNGQIGQGGAGNPGMGTSIYNFVTGAGGASLYGGGGSPVVSITGPGNNGVSFGSGGSGAGNNNQGPQLPGYGANGMVRVEEYSG